MPFRTLLLALLLLVPPQVGARTDIARQSVRVEGRVRTYWLYVPGAATDAPPLVVLLHGSGDNGLAMVRLWKSVADREGMVLLAPDALHTDAWRLKEDGPRVLAAVLGAATAKARIDPYRIYLFGQSGGAVYALLLAMLESDYFAAVSVHAGSWRETSAFNAIAIARRKIPLQIIIGDRDEFFSLASVRATEAALQAAGFPIEVDVVAGQHHWYNDKTAPGINAMAWAFLAPRRLDAAPSFTLYGREK